ncbi:hypothetical protein [Actinomadura coerulea]|uniref:hypothetical protein n=1 Tax=Actinomadura coerulea TaxID=46159 RepID=UPI0034439D75
MEVVMGYARRAVIRPAEDRKETRATAAQKNRTDVADLTEREPAPSEARAGPQRSDQDMGLKSRGQSGRRRRDQYIRA